MNKLKHKKWLHSTIPFLYRKRPWALDETGSRERNPKLNSSSISPRCYSQEEADIPYKSIYNAQPTEMNLDSDYA